MKSVTRRIQKLAALVVLALPGLLAANANAQTLIVDRSNAVGGLISGPLVPGQGFSQVFIPTVRGLDWFQFRAASPGISTVQLELYFTYSIDQFPFPIATSAPMTLTNNSLETIEFRFPTTIRLIANQFYTAKLELVSGDSYRLEYSNSNPFGGGFALNQFNQIVPTMDLVFAEGIIAVPEPAVSLLAGGALIVLTLRRKRGDKFFAV